MSNLPIPQRIQRIPSEGLVITWSNGSTSEISARRLRSECPCAECRQQRGDRSHSAPLSPHTKPTDQPRTTLSIVEHTAEESLTIERVWAVGTYAIGIRWLDGHDSGIYRYEHLWSLSLHPGEQR